jgi:hypothetical protein
MMPSEGCSDSYSIPNNVENEVKVFVENDSSGGHANQRAQVGEQTLKSTSYATMSLLKEQSSVTDFTEVDCLSADVDTIFQFAQEVIDEMHPLKCLD